MALNFEEPIWIECEINSVSSSRGNLYLDLIEEDESNNVIAKASGTIWYRQFLFIKKKLKDLTDSILSDGVKVKVKAQVEFHERYGYSLNITDIDPAYTFGQFELNRQKIIDELKKKNLIEQNSRLPFPTVIQKIAVISSETAAGYQDFLEQLSDNPYGYDFEIHLFQAAMQGQKTESEVVNALINAQKSSFDLIAIIRGGGSKLDLASFDNLKIATTIANAQTPVITGIGHDIDNTVTDIVAKKILRTPTAVADFIIEHNMNFESQILQLHEYIKQATQYHLANYERSLNHIEDQLKFVPKSRVQLLQQELDAIHKNIFSHARNILEKRNLAIDNFTNVVRIMEPKNILKRGFVLISKDGKYLKRSSDVKATDKLQLEFYDDNILVQKVKNEK